MRGWTTGAAAGVLLLTLGGCGLLGGSSSGSDGGSSAPGGSGGVAATLAAASPGASVAPLPVIGTRQSTDDDIPLEISLNEVHVGEKVMEVTWSVHNPAPAPTPGSTDQKRWQVAGYFSDGQGSSWDADAIYVVDSKNAKRYLTARTADGTCVCPVGLAGTFVGSGQTMAFSAVYQAPPADVSTVDVVIPGAGTFAKVAVSR